MQNKRGLSAVVTTLIIILLALVSIGVVWVVVNNLLKSSAEQIDLGKFTLDLEIKSVQVAGDDVTVTVKVKRNPGEGDFIGMNFIFSDGKNSEIFTEYVLLNELDEETFTFVLQELNGATLKAISVAPIYELNSGKEKTGNVADMYDFSTGVSVSDGGTGTGGVVSEAYGGAFEELGFIGTGRIEYDSISSGSDEEGQTKLPEFKKAIVDPLDVLPGDSQTFTVHLYSPNEISEVTSTTQLDNSVSDLIFEKTGELDGNEIWSVTWVVEDVHTITYRTTITAIDTEENQNSFELSWTDSCQSQITHGAAESHISTTCATGIGETGGVDGGDLVIDSGKTLTISEGSTWGFNGGETITVTGSISMDGGEIKKGYLYYTDIDGDNYAPDTTLTYSSSSTWTGRVRAKDESTIFAYIDCNDNSVYVYLTRNTIYTDVDQDGIVVGSSSGTECTGASTTVSGRTYYNTVSNDYSWLGSTPVGINDCDDNNDQLGTGLNCYYDGDGDGYGAGSVDVQCAGSCSANYVEDINTDCCDTDANAKPGQTNYYSVTRTTCGGYDYNCDSSETKQYTLTGGGCDSCAPDYDLEICEYTLDGTDGAYSAAYPACGVAGNYITSAGDGETCTRPYDECGTANSCTSEQRTQKCR